MASVTVDETTFEKLRFSAVLMGCTPGEVVALLVSRLDREESAPTEPAVRSGSAPTLKPDLAPAVRPSPTPVTQSGSDAHHPRAQEGSSAAREARWIAVYHVFKGQTFEAEFNPSSLEVRITSAPWSGKVFSSPTAAAEAVVSHVPGKRETVSTNGRKFWRLRSGNGDLRTVIGQRF